jgi:hypothetical protein
MVQETQTLMDTLKTPPVISRGDMMGALQSFAPELGLIGEQLSQLAGQAQAAEMTETSEGLRTGIADLPPLMDGAIRAVTDLRKNLRQLNNTLRSIGHRDTVLREKAGEEGYTV